MLPFLLMKVLRLLSLLLPLSLLATPSENSGILDLSGIWRFAQGNPEPSFPQGALPDLSFSDSIQLPGTTETRGKGDLNEGVERGGLTRLKKFEGAAWYERDVDIPASWEGKRVVLSLERSKLTQVWWNGKPCGSQLLFGAPQRYDLSNLTTPGRHRLTILVDNRLSHWPLKSDIHQYSDNTQTNWNGLLGRLELLATDEVWLDDIHVVPQVPQKRFLLRLRLGNRSGKPFQARVQVQGESFNHTGPVHRISAVQRDKLCTGTLDDLDLELPLGAEAKLWDEFSPSLYRLRVGLVGEGFSDERSLEVGLREFATRESQFTINGRTTFLRGKHDACVFPLTGHPPMELEGWMKFMGVLREYGLNHFRCHTWLPPKAAFEAADRLGIYLQPETPFWGTFDEKVRDALMPEALAALREYGNHASFVMMTLGNEMGGDRGLMNAMVGELRRLDPRRLYADGCNNVLWDPRHQATNDFWVSAKIINANTGNKAVPARGSFCVFDGDEGAVQWGPPNTMADLSAAVAGVPVPIVGHETGQWTTYPDYGEIAKYTGVTRARNLERFRASLKRHGMLDQNRDFFRASGALAAQLYKEENELALRTPGFGGFQLLDLQDYPGQGTALVGMLDAFMDSKGLVTPETWRESCSEIVPLARFARMTWTTGEVFEAELELAHYGAQDIAAAQIGWQIEEEGGRVMASGKEAVTTLQQGGLRKLGRIRVALNSARAPARHTLVVTVTDSGKSYRNRWPLWIYPDKPTLAVPQGVSLVRAYDERTRTLLRQGRRVLLIPDSRSWANTVKGGYATDYWCWPMFNNTPGTMGLLCDPAHPALAAFPSSFHSERQWSVLCHAATPVILAQAPSGFRPIVQVIDNLERNEKLGLILEAQVGEGSLLICAVDLLSLQQHPEARQLLSSLLGYAASPAFAPSSKWTEEMLGGILGPNLGEGRPVEASSFLHPPWGSIPAPERAVDGDICTRWIASGEDSSPTLSVDLGRSCTLKAVELLWENDEPGYRYRIEGLTNDGKWSLLSDQSENHHTGGRHFLKLSAEGVKQLRLTLLAHPQGARFSLRDIRVLGD